jgi:hypothetical protein
VKLRQQTWFKQARYWIGYGLFAALVIYSVLQAPHQIWNLQPIWLAATIFFIALMLPIELAQFFVFLRYHNRPWRQNILLPISITTRKSVLNAILPSQSGTFLLLYMITNAYKLKWHDYVRFMLVVTAIMLFISFLATISLFLPNSFFLLLLILVFGISLIAGRFIKRSYFRETWLLLLTGGGIYLSRLLVFWAILHALNEPVSFEQASYFAIVTNTLAQIPMTPGNIGIREAIFGLLSPYLALPTTVGVMIGAIFQVLRIIVYTLLMLLADVIHTRYYGRESFTHLVSQTTEELVASGDIPE